MSTAYTYVHDSTFPSVFAFVCFTLSLFIFCRQASFQTSKAQDINFILILVKADASNH